MYVDAELIFVDTEHWIKIPLFEKYMVSNKGRIKYDNKRLYNGTIISNGYVYFNLSMKNKKKQILVHRVVAQNFLSNIKNLPCVNHKDGNKSNNRVENLEWISYSDNLKHAIDNKLNNSSLDNKISVTRINPDTNETKIYNSIKDTSIDGFNISQVQKCVSTKTKNGYEKTHRGYIWRKTYITNKIDEISLLQEEWKYLEYSKYTDVNIFDNYQVSNYGRIKNNNGKMLKQSIKSNHCVVTLSSRNINTKGKQFQVHRLVLMAFNVSNHENKKFVDHIDTNPQNNHISNLKWATPKENSNNILTLSKRTK